MTKLNTPLTIKSYHITDDVGDIEIIDSEGQSLHFECRVDMQKLSVWEELVRRANAYDELVTMLKLLSPLVGVNAKQVEDLLTKLTEEK